MPTFGNCADCGKQLTHNRGICCRDCRIERNRQQIRQGFEDKFWARVRPTGFCWEWTGQLDAHGYGTVKTPDARTQSKAHRVSYELMVGPIPEGLVIDHLCRNTVCVNPDHLEPVTTAENTRRGLPGMRRPTCYRGHEWTEDNIFPKPNGGRECRRCRNAAKRAYYERGGNHG